MISIARSEADTARLTRNGIRILGHEFAFRDRDDVDVAPTHLFFHSPLSCVVVFIIVVIIDCIFCVRQGGSVIFAMGAIGWLVPVRSLAAG